MENEKKKEKCGIVTTPELELPNKICQASCRTCKSPYLQEVHQLRKDGMRLRDISRLILKKYDAVLSASNLCRHFQNYNKIRDRTASEIIESDLLPDAVQRAAHTSSIIGLIDGYLKLLKEQFDAGVIKVSVSDLQKLMDIRYKILDSNGDDDANLNVIFENFMNKYGSGDQPLKSASNETLNFENSQDRKEAECSEVIEQS